MGDCFACTVPLLVHELVLSSRSSAVSMTNLSDLEVKSNKQACLVLLKHGSPARSPFSRIDLYLEELSVWNMC